MSNKEDALKKSLIAFQKAKERMERAQKAYRDEVDAIVLKPVQVRNITREQAIKLARAIENDEAFELIMELNPYYSVKEETQEDDSQGTEEEEDVFDGFDEDEE